ncbi:cystathionine gamma-lyase [Anaeromicrobium sediminis]|uniref:homocysteine desulfhydrase n=2 Tax=Anaeromicrobium sediminis TaxID=1478221 RepID=A0A267MMM9_9FIRM|nr:cystathionine gamma-lyase [Anaeromicrobium sediminis]
MINHFGEERFEHGGAVVPPIYQNTLFTFENWDHIDKAFSDPINNNIYTRGNNPSVTIAEKKLAKLAGGERAKLFSSGMAAISAAIMYCVKSGDHIITLKNLYGPSLNFINEYLKNKWNVGVTLINGEDVEEIEKAIRPNTTLIYLESPSSAVFTIQDLSKISEIARANGIKTIVDNSWATPLFQKTLLMGIDMEVHSCSKYIGGHSDVVAGVVIGKKDHIESIALNEYLLFGGKLAPFEGWLLTRSLRTLSMRMDRHQSNGMMVAKFLESHPKVKTVRYPGLESHPQHKLAKSQMKGFTGLMSFELHTEDLDKIKGFVNVLNYFKIGVSWGGHESLIYAPAISYLREMTSEAFKETGLSLGVIRISVGLEDSKDLIDDLANALSKI